MKTTLTLMNLGALLALSMAPLPTAVAAESPELAQQTKVRMETLREECARIRNQINLTLEERNRLRNDKVELRPQFEKYTAELGRMEEQAKIARDRVMAMEKGGLAFFKAWEDQIKSISNPDIKEQARKRYDKRVKSYNKITKAMTEARDLLVPFMSDLNDIKKLLDSELSRESIKSAKQLFVKSGWNGEHVVEALKDVESELDRVAAELAKYK